MTALSTLIYLTDDLLRKSIGRMKNELFTTHEVIVDLMRNDPSSYIEELNCVAREFPNRPFQVLHSRIGKQLASLVGSKIEKSERLPTLNIFGYDSENQEWHKL
jgi:hypothetical protein